jgi:CRISPR type III-B/RAMP module-associated protein Cmr3
MPEYLLEPFDLLFFRDARPMAAGQGTGHGCRLPLPGTLHEALRTALLEHWGDRPATDAHSRNNFTKRATTTHVQVAHGAFQSLRLRGPFLYGAREQRLGETAAEWAAVPDAHKQPALRLPLPLDVVVAGRQQLQTLQLRPDPNAKPLPLLPVSPVAPSKDTPAGFWTPGQFAAYLRGEADQDFRPLPTDALFEPEHRVGVEINGDTFTAREGQLYAATYLRPAQATRFWFHAEIADRRRTEEIDLLAQLDLLLLGGERRLARLRREAGIPHLDATTLPAPDYQALKCPRVKWTLLTPALFSGGWLPGWIGCIEENVFEVKLRRLNARERAARRKARRDGERFDLAADSAAPIRARLVSICLGRPQPITGWDIVNQTAKPTRLAVPAGSVFYFECDTPQDAAILAEALHLRPRSDALGEKGYGLGVCGRWQPFRTSADVSNADKLNT